ncbi:AI-2E family transporter [Caldibacillus lycopersici]|uniref:AI-2E family transporter n=1 Tax=Perspicuibacillus lycopersici TaxID=1325689 RepID=A0AAE3ISX3_9BACI|nr:AI-2E family transporter [Perspicuibacillus lycopersici]MCU9612859.1 AI-2E family transporter [Perspicuibacillus lycopersici]
MKQSKLQYWTLQILLIVGIIFICTKISFLFEPVFIFASTLFFPILISGFLFFIFNPMVTFASKYKVPRPLGILLIYVLFIGLIIVIFATAGPVITNQVTELVKNIPGYIDDAEGFINDFSKSSTFEWIQNQDYVDLEELGDSIATYLSDLPKAISSSVSSIVSVITNVALTAVTVPFLLFYMLKDGHKMPGAIVRFLPTSLRDEGLIILKDTTKTLSAYIQGQMIVSLCVGTLSFIGYLIIGLPYALILALVVAVTNIIPYVGPFLGAAPAVIVALFVSPMTALFTIIVAIIAQQVESNVISPLVIGKSLDTHPATIIIVLLVAGNLAGVIGMILAVPVYAVTKTFVLNIVRLIRLQRKHKKEKLPPSVV